MRIVALALIFFCVLTISYAVYIPQNDLRSRIARNIRQDTPGETTAPETTTTTTAGPAPTTTTSTAAPSEAPTTTTTNAPVPTTTTSTAAPGTPTTTTTTSSPSTPTTAGPGTPIVPQTTLRPTTTTTLAPGQTARPTTTTTRAPTTTTNTTVVIDASQAFDYTKVWAPIVGAVVGGGLLVGLLAIIICFRVRRIRMNKKLLASENISGSDSAPGVSLPTQHFDTLSPSVDQEEMANFVYQLGEAFKRNKFNEVTALSHEMYEIVGVRGLLLPNPSNLFIALIRIMESDQFLHADPRRQLDVIRVTHRIAALSLLEKAHRGTRLTDDSKKHITQNISTLKRIAAVEKGGVDRPDEFEMNFHLDCLSQCLFLMEDTSLSADKLVRAVSNVTNPGVLLNMVSSEIEITPRAWYRPILVASLLTHLAREDENVLLSIMTRPALFDKISADQTWRTGYHHAMLLGEILSSENSTESICMMALTGETVDAIKLTERKLVSMTTLLSFGQKNNSGAVAVRAKAFSETYRAVSKTKHHAVRSVCMMLLLERRIQETNQEVRALIDKCMSSAVTSGGLLDQWKKEINHGAQHVIEELDREWQQLQENRAILNQRRNEHNDMSRLLAMKTVEMNEIQSRLNRKRASLTFQNQQAAVEKATAELKQIKKQEAFDVDQETARSNVLKRIELEDLLDTLPQEEVKRVTRMEQVVLKLESELNELSGKLVTCSAEMEQLELKVKEQQDTFDIKRNNFETVQKDFTVASLLSVQEIENKTRNVEHVEQMSRKGSVTSPYKVKVVEPREEVAIDVEDETPNAFICPITHHVMHDPVFVIDTGHTYEKEAIERWFTTHDTDPMTGVRVKNKTLAPNHSLRKMIREYKA